MIAVPTSVGYGAALGGMTALLAMLNSCAPNVAVVNIDNGFGAACFATSLLGINVSATRPSPPAPRNSVRKKSGRDVPRPFLP